MKSFFCLFTLLLIFLHFPARSGNPLFDDTRLSSVYITIPKDSLAVIYDSVLNDHYFLARFVFDDSETRDTLENVGFRLRGNSSRYAQKKSFKISFSEYVSGRKYHGVKKLNLNGEHNDPTMIREKLFYDLWKKAGMVERRTNFVKLYINGVYYGLYTNLEEMGKEWLSRVYLKDGGNLYKCAYPADMVYHGDDQQVYKNLQNTTVTGGQVYELETNTSEDDYTRLVELISVLNQQPTGQFANDVRQVLNVDHYLKAFALDVATGNWDDYSYNRNNFYFYDDPSGMKFEFITYDPDNTFGTDWMGIDWGTRDCRSWVNQGIWLPMARNLLSVPEFYDRYKMFLDTIARNVINPDSVFARIDLIKEMIRQAAVEDTFRTLDYGYTIQDFDDGFIKGIDQHTPYGIKPFLGVRKQAILDQLNPSGTWDQPEVSEVTVFPNPASDNISIRLKNAGNGPYQIRIFDNFGKKTMEIAGTSRNDQILTLPVQDLSGGLYLLRLETGSRVYQAKFIKK